MADLNSLVERWVAADIISPEQGQRILAEHPSPTQVSMPRGSLIAEALSYVGGILVLVAAIIIGSVYWPHLSTPARSALIGGAAALVLIAGLLLPTAMGAARGRLRAVLWALAVALCGLWIGITLDGLRITDETGVLLAASGAALLALFLWGYHKSALQLAALGISLAVVAGSAAAHLPRDREDTVGLAIWGLGLAWLALTWGALLIPQRVGFLLGGAAIVAGSQLTAQHDWGLALAGVSMAALVTAAVLLRDLYLLGVGAVGVLLIVPNLVNRFFPGDLAAPIALLIAGAALIGLGVLMGRKRSEAASKPALGVLPAPWSIGLALLIVAAMTPVVLTVGQAW